MNMLLIAPYVDMVKTAQETLKQSPYPVKVLLGDLQNGLQVAYEEISKEHPDIIISRGGTASLLRKNLSLPVFEINVSGYDLLRAIYPHIHRNQKVAVIGYENVVSGAKSIAEIIGGNLGYFSVGPNSPIDSMVTSALDWGADVVVGDTVSVRTAEARGMMTELIRSGSESMLNAIESAANFLSHMKDEILRNKRLNLIMEHSDRGELYIATNGRIDLMNARAEQILNRRKELLLNNRFNSGIIPESLVDAINQGEVNQLVQINDRDYIVDINRIEIKGENKASLVFIQSSGRIRDLEGMLRTKMINRGLIASHTFDSIIAKDASFIKTVEKARQYSRTNSNILLLGETGVGKEIFAQSIHNASSRKMGPFVAINCAALPESLLESELFGYVEGAFSGARRGGKPGLFEMAHTGTIFLDEINDMSKTVQSRLLRVLQEKQVMRIGDDRVINVDVRVIAASNTDLFAETEVGNFRKDLYYRLRVLDIEIPPLRSRKDDIIPLFKTFLQEYITPPRQFTSILMNKLFDSLVSYSWPGNVRQLRNFSEKVCVLMSLENCNEEIINDLINELGENHRKNQKNSELQMKMMEEPGLSLKNKIANLVKSTWEQNNHNISETARQLGIDRVTVRRYLQQEIQKT